MRVVNITPVQLSNEKGVAWQPSLGVNPADPDKIVMVVRKNTPPGNVGYWYSSDRGDNWQFISQSGDQADQSIGLGVPASSTGQSHSRPLRPLLTWKYCGLRTCCTDLLPKSTTRQ